MFLEQNYRHSECSKKKCPWHATMFQVFKLKILPRELKQVRHPWHSLCTHYYDAYLCYRFLSTCTIAHFVSGDSLQNKDNCFSVSTDLVALSIVSVLTLFLILMLALAIRLKKKASGMLILLKVFLPCSEVLFQLSHANEHFDSTSLYYQA